MPKTIEENLARAVRTRAERKKLYGDAHIRHGSVMKGLYPKGITLNSPEDFARFGALNMVVSKLTRYTTDPDVGHPDSAHDLIVYSAILEELT
jgi:hypothetical protein